MDSAPTAGGTGLGDVMVLVKYRFYRRDSPRGTTQTSITVGPKIPTGRTKPGRELDLHRAFQREVACSGRGFPFPDPITGNTGNPARQPRGFVVVGFKSNAVRDIEDPAHFARKIGLHYPLAIAPDDLNQKIGGIQRVQPKAAALVCSGIFTTTYVPTRWGGSGDIVGANAFRTTPPPPPS